MYNVNSIEEFFGTLQDAFIQTWRLHLCTSKYSSHIALEEFYTSIVEKVDALIEAWISTRGKVNTFTNLLSDDATYSNPVAYLEALREFVRAGRHLIEGQTELESIVDDILGLIDSTLYKLKNLTESRMKSLYEYICEQYKYI